MTPTAPSPARPACARPTPTRSRRSNTPRMTFASTSSAGSAFVPAAYSTTMTTNSREPYPDDEIPQFDFYFNSIKPATGLCGLHRGQFSTSPTPDRDRPAFATAGSGGQQGPGLAGRAAAGSRAYILGPVTSFDAWTPASPCATADRRPPMSTSPTARAQKRRGAELRLHLPPAGAEPGDLPAEKVKAYESG